VTYYEREMKFGLQFSLTYGIPPILIPDGRQEVVRDLVAKRPLVRERGTGGIEKRFKCVTLVVNGEGEVVDVGELCGGRDVLVEILEQKRLGVLGLMPCARNGSTKEERGKMESGWLTIWGVTGHAWGFVMLSDEEE